MAGSDGGVSLALTKSEQRRLLKTSKREAAMRAEILSKLQVIDLLPLLDALCALRSCALCSALSALGSSVLFCGLCSALCV